MTSLNLLNDGIITRTLNGLTIDGGSTNSNVRVLSINTDSIAPWNNGYVDIENINISGPNSNVYTKTETVALINTKKDEILHSLHAVNTDATKMYLSYDGSGNYTLDSANIASQATLSNVQTALGDAMDDIAALNTQVGSLNSSVSGFSNTVNTLSTNVSTLSGNVATNSSNLASLQSNLTSNYYTKTDFVDVSHNGILKKEDFAAFKNGADTVATFSTSISNLNSSVNTINSEINTINSNIDSLNASADGFANAFSDVNSDISSLRGRVSSAESAITGLEATVSAVGIAETALAATVAANTTAITANSAAITAIQTELGTIEGEVTYIASEQSAMNGQYVALESTVATNTAWNAWTRSQMAVILGVTSAAELGTAVYTLTTKSVAEDPSGNNLYHTPARVRQSLSIDSSNNNIGLNYDVSGGRISASAPTASASTTGLLSSTDHATFSNKVSTTQLTTALQPYAIKSAVDASFNNVYTKSAVDASFNNVYTKAAIDASLNNIYTTELQHEQSITALGAYYNSLNTTVSNNKAAVDASFNNVYTKSAVDASFNNVYTKTAIDASFNNVYTKTAIDASFNNVYTKTAIDASFNNVYTKTAIDASFNNVYTKNAIDASFNAIPTTYYNKTYIDTSFNAIPSIARGAISVDNSGNNVTLTYNNSTGVLKATTTAGGASQWTTSGSTIYYGGGNVGIGTTGPSAYLHVNPTTQTKNHILITGQESYAAGNSSTGGIQICAAVNRTNNRQLWVCDSTSASNTTNGVFRIQLNSGGVGIGAVSTDGTTNLPLGINTHLQITNGNIGIHLPDGTTPRQSIDIRDNIGAGSFPTNVLIQSNPWTGNVDTQGMSSGVRYSIAGSTDDTYHKGATFFSNANLIGTTKVGSGRGSFHLATRNSNDSANVTINDTVARFDPPLTGITPNPLVVSEYMRTPWVYSAVANQASASINNYIYFPVVFGITDPDAGCGDVTICRGNVHLNGTGTGSFNLRIQWRPSRWGNGAQWLRIVDYGNNQTYNSTFKIFVADINIDATSGYLIVHLRGCLDYGFQMLNAFPVNYGYADRQYYSDDQAFNRVGSYWKNYQAGNNMTYYTMVKPWTSISPTETTTVNTLVGYGQGDTLFLQNGAFPYGKPWLNWGHYSGVLRNAYGETGDEALIQCQIGGDVAYKNVQVTFTKHANICVATIPYSTGHNCYGYSEGYFSVLIPVDFRPQPNFNSSGGASTQWVVSTWKFNIGGGWYDLCLFFNSGGSIYWANRGPVGAGQSNIGSAGTNTTMEAQSFTYHLCSSSGWF
jgi:peptidoglycan hydrolase CwlO-like protein